MKLQQKRVRKNASPAKDDEQQMLLLLILLIAFLLLLLFLLGYLIERVGQEREQCVAAESIESSDLTIPTSFFSLTGGKVISGSQQVTAPHISNNNLTITTNANSNSDNNSNNNSSNSNNSNTNNSSSGSSAATPTPTPISTPTPLPTPTPTPLPEGFLVYNYVGQNVWQAVQAVPVFAHTENTNVAMNRIAPGITSSFDFIVRNNQDVDATYVLQLLETNAANINMLCRLQRNGSYLFGDATNWVEPTTIQIPTTPLLARQQDNYILEWQWVDDGTHDAEHTQLGQLNNATYGLSIKVTGTIL